MDDAAIRKEKPTTAFSAKALAKLGKELEQARRDAEADAVIVKRIAFLETGLRWTEIEVAAHPFLGDPTKADKAAAKKVLDQRIAFMRESF